MTNELIRIGIDGRMFSSSFTGIGRYVYELVQHLAQLETVRLIPGRKVEFVIFLSPVEASKWRSPAKNFRCVPVSARHYSLAEQTSFLAALIKERLDLMHFTHFNAPLLYPGRSIVTIHDLTLSYFPGQKMVSLVHRAAYNLVLRRAVTHSSRIVAVSRHTKKDLCQLLKTDPQKIQVIYNGVGAEFAPAKDRTKTLAKLTRRYSLRGDYLLYTGVWRDHKNLLGLLEAIAQARQNNARKKFDGQLVITGRPDPIYAPAILAAIARLGLKDIVRLVGLVPEEDLIALMQCARAFVFPSFYEGFGLPPLEAMACGVPVAASNASCIPEICGPGNAAYFDPYDQGDMAQQIGLIWNNQTLRRQLIRRGLIRAAEFHWSTTAQQTWQAYRKALQL